MVRLESPCPCVRLSVCPSLPSSCRCELYQSVPSGDWGKGHLSNNFTGIYFIFKQIREYGVIISFECMYLAVCLSSCLPACLFVCLSVCVSVGLSQNPLLYLQNNVVYIFCVPRVFNLLVYFENCENVRTGLRTINMYGKFVLQLQPPTLFVWSSSHANHAVLKVGFSHTHSAVLYVASSSYMSYAVSG